MQFGAYFKNSVLTLMNYLKHIITILTFHFSNHSYKVRHSSNKSHILTISAHVKNTQTHSHKDRHLFLHTAWSQTTAKNQEERIKETISYKNEFSSESADLMDRGRLHSLGATTSKSTIISGFKFRVRDS